MAVKEAARQGRELGRRTLKDYCIIKALVPQTGNINRASRLGSLLRSLSYTSTVPVMLPTFLRCFKVTRAKVYNGKHFD